MHEPEGPAIAGELVCRDYLNELISKDREQPLMVHALNGNAIRATTLCSRLEALACSGRDLVIGLQKHPVV